MEIFQFFNGAISNWNQKNLDIFWQDKKLKLKSIK